jgi:hypothetical protein
MAQLLGPSIEPAVTKTIVLFPMRTITAADIAATAYMGPVMTLGASGVRFDVDVEQIADNALFLVVDAWDDAKKDWAMALQTGIGITAPGHYVHAIDPRLVADPYVNRQIPAARLRARWGGGPTTVRCSLAYTLGN